MPLEKIKEKLIETKKVKYFKDEDGVLRTTKCRYLMSKKDIKIIFNLFNIQKYGPERIAKFKHIKYNWHRIKKLIGKFEDLKNRDPDVFA